MAKFFFDLETGGIDPRTSILSVGFAKDNQQAQELYAEPTAGTRLYKWSEENVWSRIKDKAKKSEETQLKSFLGVLQQQEEGTELIGWNTGYSRKYNEEAAGYDIQKLFQRARKFGLGSEYESALSKFQTRDIGREFSIHLARANTSLPGIDPLIAEESMGYLKKNYLAGDPVSAKIAARYLPADVKLPGWRLSDIYKVAFGEELTGAHGAQQDVAATQRLHQYTEQYQGFNLQDQDTVKRLQDLSRESHKRVLVNNIFNLKAESPEQAKSIYQEMLQRGKDAGITGIEDDLKKRLQDEGVSFTDLLSGQGAQRKYRLYNRVDTSSFNIRNVVSSVAESGLGYAKKNPWKTGIVGGLAAAYVLQAGSLFSGKDDKYNTIEGLPHGWWGKQRKENTDFGSGFLSKHGPIGGIKGLFTLGKEEVVNRVQSALSKQYEVLGTWKENWEKIFDDTLSKLGLNKISDIFKEHVISGRNFTSASIIEGESRGFISLKKPIEQNPFTFMHEASEAFQSILKPKKSLTKTHFGTHVNANVIFEEAVWSASRSQEEFWNARQIRSQERLDILDIISEQEKKKQYLQRKLNNSTLETQNDSSLSEQLKAKRISFFKNAVDQQIESIDQSIKNHKKYIKVVSHLYKTVENRWLPRFRNPELVKDMPFFKQSFSGKDDAYNTIEGLGHGDTLNTGLHQASQTRPDHGFGSGFLRRLYNVARTGVNESIREISHIVNGMIIPGVKNKQPLEIGVAALTSAEIFNTAAAALGGTLTVAGAVGTAASLSLSKFIYAGIKKRNEIKQAVQLASKYPEETKIFAKETTTSFTKQMSGYLFRGEQNPLSTFVKYGGGDLGRQALIARYESGFSGKDDVYNIIEGLRHGGYSEQIRKLLTDFGSGYRGVLKAIGKEAGNSLSRVKQWMKVNAIKVDPSGPGAFYKVDRNAIVFNQKDLMHDMLSKGLTQEETNLTLPIMLQHEAFEAFHTKRLGKKDASYLLPGGWMGKKTTFGSHVTPAVIGDEMLVAAESGQATFNALKKFRLAEAAQGSKEYNRRIQKMYKTFENKVYPGLADEGIRQHVRHDMTPFGSKWDAMRNAVIGKETFGQMLENTGFQNALKNARQLSELGKGTTATTYLMEGSFRGKNFQFARKVSAIPTANEVEALKAAQDSVTPSVYRSFTEGKSHSIDMELFEGRTFTKLNQKERDSAKVLRDMAYDKLHMSGHVQVDTNSGNVMLVNTPQGPRVGLIDMGYAASTKNLSAVEAKEIQQLEKKSLDQNLMDQISTRRKMRDLLSKRKISMSESTQTAMQTSMTAAKYGGRNHAR